MIHCDTLLKNAIDIITKCDNYFVTKYGKSSLQNALGFLSQIETVLLQNATVITKCDGCYKLQQYIKSISNITVIRDTVTSKRFLTPLL